MPYSQKYCLVQLLAPMDVGDEFASSDWPLHCTIAGVFTLDWTDERRKEFARIVARHARFQSVTTDITRFGPDATIKVRLVDVPAELYRLHTAVVDFIEQNGGRFNEPHFLREHFRPHITIRDDQPPAGETIDFTQLTLIDMFPGGDHTGRRILTSLPLATKRSNL